MTIEPTLQDEGAPDAHRLTNPERLLGLDFDYLRPAVHLILRRPMSKLVEELKADHVQLKQTLKQAADFKRPAQESIELLHRVKAALLAHLDKENRELYPTLQAAAASDPSLHSLLSSFGKDMEQIIPQALAFFAKYDDPAGVSGKIKSDVRYAVEFGADLERFIGLLGLRIGREERSLYPQYERIKSKKAA